MLNKDKLKEYDNLGKAIRTKVDMNCKETLVSLKDILLPKSIPAKIHLQNMEINF